MKHASKLRLWCAACAALLAAANVSHAVMPAPPAPAARVAQASMIVVGKVDSFEEKTVFAKAYAAAQNKAEYKVAVIKISDPIQGAKGLTTVRVGFVPPPMGVVLRRPMINFTKDQEVLLFLTPQGEANFMVAQGYYDVVEKKGNKDFDKDVEAAKKFVKILANPKESLKAEKEEDRLNAAALLIFSYRATRLTATEVKTEPVDAEVSKLILTALGDANWKQQLPEVRSNPQDLFRQLNITAKDGFTPPMVEFMGRPQIDQKKFLEVAKKWCKDNAEKYRIERNVFGDKTEESKEEKKDK
jgi:hypothetical protein